MAIADFVSKRLQRAVFALLLLAMVQFSLAARDDHPHPAGAVIVPVSLISPGSR